MSEAEATAQLRDAGGYEWLLEGKAWWDAQAVADALGETGIGVSKPTVLKWFRDLPHTQDFGGLGLRASRGDLLTFFASRRLSGGAGSAAVGQE